MLENLGYALFNEDVQCVEREVVSVIELTPADLGADVTEDSFMLETRDGLGAIPVGAILVWSVASQKLEQLGTHYFPGGTTVFDQKHPMTAALVEESKRRLVESGHKGGWRLDGAGGRTIWMTPVEDTLAELEEQFAYPAGCLNKGD